jgi:hypothetical protein
MAELPQYVAMSPDEYHIHRRNGRINMGSFVDHIRQPGVVGLYGKKPVFLYVNQAEEDALLSGDIETYYKLRGYKTETITNKPPEGPKITIP